MVQIYPTLAAGNHEELVRWRRGDIPFELIQIASFFKIGRQTPKHHERRLASSVGWPSAKGTEGQAEVS